MKELKLITSEKQGKLVASLQDPIHYRKSGLSLNHIIGCPIECAYCVRHKDFNWEMKIPQMLMSDEEAVTTLINHKFFQPDITPIQLLNKATDSMLPNVKPHLFNILDLLDKYGFKNNVLIISRYKVKKEDCDKLNSYHNLKITLLITYSGITDTRIEPIPNKIPVESLKIAFENAISYRTILYWRPIVPGLNDSDMEIDFCLNNLSNFAHAVVFTGLFFNKEIQHFFIENNLPELYNKNARRKILPDDLERRIIKASRGSAADGKLFRKTSCAVSYAHNMADYNGHVGVKEICDICTIDQINICKKSHKIPTNSEIQQAAKKIGLEISNFDIIGQMAIQLTNINEDQRYFLQHSLNFQIHNTNYPHAIGQHGRADEFRELK